MMQNMELRKNIYGRMTDCGRAMDVMYAAIDNAQHENSCEQLLQTEQAGHVEHMEARLQHLSETFQLLRDTTLRLEVQHDIIQADMRSSTQDLIRVIVCPRDAHARTHGG